MNLDLKNPKTQKFLLGGVVFLFLVYLWYSKVFTPSSQKIQAQKSRYQVMVSELVRLQAKAATLKDLRKEYQELSSALKPLEKLLPEEESITLFLNLLHDAASGSTVLIRELTPMGPTSQGDFIANDFQMGLEGSYHDFGRFLARAANFPFIVKVSQMRLKSYLKAKIQEEETQKTLMARFLITTYSLNSETD